MGALDYRGAQGGPPVAVSPDSLSGVIGQTQNHLNEVENRLSNLLCRISPMPQDPNKGSKVEVAGLTSSANCVRNTASRILDLVGALENVI